MAGPWARGPGSAPGEGALRPRLARPGATLYPSLARLSRSSVCGSDFQSRRARALVAGVGKPSLERVLLCFHFSPGPVTFVNRNSRGCSIVCVHSHKHAYVDIAGIILNALVKVVRWVQPISFFFFFFNLSHAFGKHAD